MELSDISTRGLVLLGCGKMGTALLEGWLARGLPPGAVTVLEPNPSPRLNELAAGGLRLNAELPADPAVAVLAVKPQMMGAALPRLAALGTAGRSFSRSRRGRRSEPSRRRWGRATRVVRAMPNTPAAVGRGITALVGNAARRRGGRWRWPRR